MKNRGDNAGFTLLELLVSSAVLGIIMLVLLTSASTGLSLWRNTEQKVSVDREGRSATHLLAEDLAGIVNLTNANLQPRFEVSTGEAMPATPLRFFTTKPPDYQADPAVDLGDVCYVEYKFENNALRRASVDSFETFQALQSNARPVPSEADFELLATNVLQFRVWAWDAAGNSTSGSAARAVDFLMEVVDAKGLENFSRNPDLPLVGQQYFSGRSAVPPPQ